MKVGVIGAGTMGSGIAQAFAQTEGYEVMLCDINETFAANGKNKIAKGFEKRIAKGKMTQEDAQKFRQGVEIGEKNPTLPAKLEILSVENGEEGWISCINLTIEEGKFHQIKRMVQAVGKEVIYLKRISMGPLYLDENLERGQCRPLTEKEIELLKKAATKS